MASWRRPWRRPWRARVVTPALCLPHFQSLSTAMKHLCEILTTDPEGGPARIPFETFAYVYRYLSRLDPEISVAETEVYLSSLKDSV